MLQLIQSQLKDWAIQRYWESIGHYFDCVRYTIWYTVTYTFTALMPSVSRGDIFRVQTRRVSQTIVCRYREIRGRLCVRNIVKNSVVPTIDISWLDWAYKSSTCSDVMYIVDSAAIYIIVVKFINNIFPLPLQLSLHRRAALSSNPNGTRSVYSRKKPKKQSILWDVYGSYLRNIITGTKLSFII
jgi:hypothetical protein